MEGSKGTEKYSKVPLYHSLAYHSFSLNKEDPNYCVKEFLDYIKKTSNVVSKDLAKNINQRASKLTNEKDRRDLMQACNLELTIENVEDLFPNLVKSKEISRDDLEALLRDAHSIKN